MTTLPAGTIHNRIPSDLRKVLTDNTAARATWKIITPLARNEWICWVENAKLNETRTRRILRARHDLAEGKHRPCCWIGCTHRTDKEVSPSVRHILEKSNRSTRKK